MAGNKDKQNKDKQKITKADLLNFLDIVINNVAGYTSKSPLSFDKEIKVDSLFIPFAGDIEVANQFAGIFNDLSKRYTKLPDGNFVGEHPFTLAKVVDSKDRKKWVDAKTILVMEFQNPKEIKEELNRLRERCLSLKDNVDLSIPVIKGR